MKLLQRLLFLLFCFSISNSFGQNYDFYFKSTPPVLDSDPIWIHKMYAFDANFNDVVDAYEQYYKAHDFVKTIHTQNYKYWLKHTEVALRKGGVLIDVMDKTYLNEQEAIKNSMTKGSSKTQDIWTSMGPFDTYNMDGSETAKLAHVNVVSLAVSPTDSTVLYAISQSGGVYKTTDHGQYWHLKTKDEGFTNGQDLKISPLDPNIVYVATKNDLYLSIDGGETWNLEHTFPGRIEQLNLHRSDPSIIFAATANGLFKTVDTGVTWTNILNKKCWDIEAHPLNQDTLYVSVNNPTLIRAEVYKTMDGGLSWNLKDNMWFSPTDLNVAQDRGCKLGVTLADPDRLYAALIGLGKSNDLGWIGVYYSLDGADSWVNADGLDGAPYAQYYSATSNWPVVGTYTGYNQGWYCFDINVSEIDPDRIWAGTLQICESNNRGEHFERISVSRNLNMHLDIQNIEILGSEIWVASDGGINYSNDEMQTVEIKHSGIQATNYSGFSQGWNEDTWTGGRVHNGEAVYHENYGLGNVMFQGGVEAPTGYINQFDNRMCYYHDTFDKRTPDSLSTPGTVIENLSDYPNTSYSILYASEIAFHPYYGKVMYIGKGKELYKSIDGGVSFNVIHEFVGQWWVLEIEVSRSNPNVIYCLVTTGGNRKLFKSLDGGLNFVQAATLPSDDITRITMSLNSVDANHLWIASRLGSNGSKVYESTDGGQTWVNRTTSVLDNHLVRNMTFQYGTNNLVYLSTDQGFFYWDTTTNDWVVYNTGLPLINGSANVIPFYRDNKIRLGGRRGVWEAPVVETSLPEALPFTQNKNLFCNRDTVQFEDHSVLNHAGATWQWSFSPVPAYISSSTIRNPKVVFSNDGGYEVTLTVTDSSGNASTRTVPNMVNLNNSCLPDSVPGHALTIGSVGESGVIQNLNLNQCNIFTCSAWIKPEISGSGYVILYGDVGYGLRTSNAGELMCYWGSYVFNSNFVVPQNEWSHVAMVISPNSATIYLNGVASTYNGTLPQIDLTLLRMGRYFGNNSNINNILSFQGQMDEICIWNQALNQNQIRELRHLTRTGSMPYDTGLIAYYQFNDINSPQILDNSGSHHADLLGGASRQISSAPVGGGISSRVTVNSSGTVIFGNTGFKAQFSGNTPNGEVVATRLHLKPNVLPNSNPSISNYWIVNNYGNQSFSLVSPFSFDLNIGTAFGNPSNAFLHTRSENEHLNTWSNVCSANNFNNGIFNYDVNCTLSNFSQFFIQSNNANTIYKSFINASAVASICDNDSLLIGGGYQNQGGTYYDTISLSAIVDSVLTTELTVYDTYTFTEDYTICQGDSILIDGIYYSSNVVLTDSLQAINGCDSVFLTSVVVMSCLGVEDEVLSEILIYPNPNQGTFTISKQSSSIAVVHIQLFDQRQRLIIDKTMPSYQKDLLIDIEAESTGVYYLKMRINDTVLVKKIVRNGQD